MKNSFIYIMIVAFMLSTVAVKAQNMKTETVKILGNCGMCESTIEKAGSLKNQADVDWNKETKIATITYNSIKTSKEEILKRIALAGYDSDSFLAPNDTYSNLPGCCQYERAGKTNSEMADTNAKMEVKEHLMHSKKMNKTQEVNPLSAVFDSYFSLKDALVKTDGATATTTAKKLLTAIDDVKMDKLSMDVHMVWMKLQNDLKTDVQKIAETQNVDSQRNSFKTLSKNVYKLLKSSKTSETIYYQYCPMQDANWLSKEETIKNPYYGSQMLSCGKIVETIKE